MRKFKSILSRVMGRNHKKLTPIQYRRQFAIYFFIVH
ncbi:hypothetical protein SAMN05661091_5037 [Paenibacillus uliginis N3/975]|uniref:Uncharacterized protein n=1 Tax=Paenibacillus uliginis N3/975 TaxID=1313296 RepID=A0A1X7HQ86_9BACL|nr:hypothetical protein SAMN05661091_5037 [Paenibacillus uliginis N3/975]